MAEKIQKKAKTILIIVENLFSRSLITKYLENANYNVIAAKNPEEVLKLASNTNIGLIIQDLYLSNANGFELINKIKKLPGAAQIPILALTGFLLKTNELIKNTGFSGYILKPIDPFTLLEIVNKCIDRDDKLINAEPKKKSILIVDDNNTQLNFLHVHLENANFNVILAEDGEMGFKKALELKPDIIISDVLMPKMDGFAFCKKVKQHPDLHSIPVILITSYYLEAGDYLLAKEAGACNYLVRNQDIGNILAEVHKILQTVSVPMSSQGVAQLADNIDLQQRHALNSMHLFLVDEILNFTSSNNKNTLSIPSIQKSLSFCADAMGFSHCVLYFKKIDNTMILSEKLKFSELQEQQIKLFLDKIQLMIGIDVNPIIISAQKSYDQITNDILQVIGLKTVLIIPLYTNEACVGVLFLGSVLNSTVYSESSLIDMGKIIGMQFSKLITLKSIFDKINSSERTMTDESDISVINAEIDHKSRVHNRIQVNKYINNAIEVAKTRNRKLAIMIIDIDNFKYINDCLGHHMGDECLKEISERLFVCLRPEDMIARLGGDEFIIILSDIVDKAAILDIINRVLHQISRPILLSNNEVFTTASIGVSVYPDDGDTSQELIKGADVAMYAAKEKGKNTYHFCEATLKEKAKNRGFLQNSLRQALENNEFLIHYQPIINLTSKKIVAMESLIRWKKNNNIILPGQFIGAIENSDLVIPITEWVLKTACQQNKVWQNLQLPHIVMSVNLSVRNLNTRLISVIETILSEIQLKTYSLEVEITERALMENIDNNIQILKTLKDMGIKISIDDFGTGYSSLSYLKRFPIDNIKIDKSFIHDIATNPEEASIVTAIIAMSHSLGYKVIAEGVETEAQFKFLIEHGCEEIQGFYYSPALSSIDATAFLKNTNYF